MPLPARIGKYEIVELIGRGGMGVVYKARDTVLGRLVALKVMTAGLADNAEVRERFLREARAVSILQHANIVVVFELGEHDEDPYIVMEYLDGEPLDRTIRANTTLSVLQKIDIILQVSKALQYAHEKGIVHRDVKPGNIMLMADGTVKVVDFGIAHLADQTMTKSGLVLGTVSYMSPEQLNGQPVDARTDIFSLGIVFYVLLTGKLPFEGASTAETMMKILMEPPPRLEQVGDIHPPELQPIIDKALAKETQSRYQTCGEFTDHLSQSRKRLQLTTQLEKLEYEKRVILAELDVPKPRRPSPSHQSQSAVEYAEPAIPPDATTNDPQTERPETASIAGPRSRFLAIAITVSVAAALAAATVIYRVHNGRASSPGLAASGALNGPVDQRGNTDSVVPQPAGNPSIDSASSQRSAAPETTKTARSGSPLGLSEQQKPQPRAEQPRDKSQAQLASGRVDTGRNDDMSEAPMENPPDIRPQIAAGQAISAMPAIQQAYVVPQPPPVQPLVTIAVPTGGAVVQKVKIPLGTQLSIRLHDPLDSKHSHTGDVWHGTLAASIQIDDQTAVPAGAAVTGRVADPRKSVSGMKHDSGLVLELISISVNGRTYKIQTNQWANLSLKRREVKLDAETVLNFQLLDALTIPR